jgi:PBSX family phage terminase large subunit
MRVIWGPEMVGDIKQDNTAYLFGETVYCLGCEKVSQVAKIRGASIKYAYGDEVAEWNPEVFELIKSRLDKEYSCFDGALNQEGPNHWLKQFLDSDADIYNQHYTIFDNPFLPKEFVDNLCKEYAGTVYYKRYILGEWALAEGLIYPMYEECLEEPLDGTELASIREWVMSIDYGTQNATTFQLWRPLKDGRWCLTKEYYHSGRAGTARIGARGQKTDRQYADDLGNILGGETPTAVIIDPAAASFREEIIQRGYKVKNAKNDVLDGIRLTASLFNQDKICVDEACVNFIKEIDGYAWDDTNVAIELPIKVNDHAMDALRYFCYTILRPKRGGIHFLK